MAETSQNQSEPRTESVAALLRRRGPGSSHHPDCTDQRPHYVPPGSGGGGFYTCNGPISVPPENQDALDLDAIEALCAAGRIPGRDVVAALIAEVRRLRERVPLIAQERQDQIADALDNLICVDHRGSGCDFEQMGKRAGRVVRSLTLTEEQRNG